MNTPGTLRRYSVRLTFQFPAWDEKQGIAFDVTARSKGEAVKRARWEAEQAGHVPAVGKGLAWFKAEDTGESP